MDSYCVEWNVWLYQHDGWNIANSRILTSLWNVNKPTMWMSGWKQMTVGLNLVIRKVLLWCAHVPSVQMRLTNASFDCFSTAVRMACEWQYYSPPTPEKSHRLLLRVPERASSYQQNRSIPHVRSRSRQPMHLSTETQPSVQFPDNSKVIIYSKIQ